MAPLKLDSLIPDDEYIEVGDKKFYITANIPRDMIFDFLDMKEELEGEMTKDKLAKCDELLIKLLTSHQKNSEPEVRAFIKGLDLVGFNKVAMFITDYIRSIVADSKKKTDLKA